jgi:hypothetical protein
MTTIKFFCHACQTFRLVEIEPVTADALNAEPWGDIVCAICHFMIATISGPAGVYQMIRSGDVRPDFERSDGDNEPTEAETDD